MSPSESVHKHWSGSAGLGGLGSIHIVRSASGMT
jgi:hypothetical protein